MAVALVLGGCATATSGSPSAGSTESTTSASTSAPESTSESPTTSDAPATSEAAETTEASSTATEPPASDLAETYVYFVVDTRSGLRLSREIRDVPKDDAGATAAIEAMFSGAIDPDYSTTWNPDTAVLSAAMEGGVISVDLSGEARTANVGSGGAALMVQQLVWTATEAFAAPDAKVQLTIDGAVAGELWGVLDWNEPIGREAAEDVRTFVQIDSPREGAEVRSPVTVTGDAAAFEANVPWRVLNAAGAEVTSGFTTTAEGMRHAPFSFQVNLAPGSYTVEISEDDPSDGAAGTPGTDTRSITVLR
jgi:spore germination protein GerM